MNLVKSGRVWLGETFDAYQSSRTFVLPLPACDSVRLFIQVAASSLSGATFTVQAGSATLGTISVPAIPGPADSYYARWGSLLRTLTSTSANLPIQLTYSGRSDSKGYLNYIEAIAYHPLTCKVAEIFRVRAGTGPWGVQGTGPRKNSGRHESLRARGSPLFQTASGYSFSVRGIPCEPTVPLKRGKLMPPHRAAQSPTRTSMRLWDPLCDRHHP